MNVEKLYTLIRQEDVILWVGAGFSLYAGYPSGATLGETIYNDLSEFEKNEINPNLLLPDLTEEYVRLKGTKKPLLDLLDNIFNKQAPLTLTYHDLVSKIPHFGTIVTTNFDNLFEIAYGDKGQKILTNNQIPQIEKDRVPIFKIHGDCSSTESVILTKSDYINFNKNDKKEEPFWSVIKTFLATKHILFLGYNLEDHNVIEIFDRVFEFLGEDMKESFLIAPMLKQHKINDLKRRRINYINSTGGDFLDNLMKNLMENVLSDFDAGILSPETYRRFLVSNNLSPALKAGKDGFKLIGISSTKGSIDGKFDLVFKKGDNLIKELNKFIAGQRFGNIEITQKNVDKLGFSIEGLKLPFNEENILKLEFTSRPKVETNFDIVFDDDFEIINLPVKIFASIYLYEFIVSYGKAKFTVTLTPQDKSNVKVKLLFDHEEIYTKVKEEIAIFKLLMKISSGEEFTIHSSANFIARKKFPFAEDLCEHASAHLDYFNKLNEIEKFFRVRFNNFAKITRNDEATVNMLMCLIKNGMFESKSADELSYKLEKTDEDTINKLKVIGSSNFPLTLGGEFEELIELHGQNIYISYNKLDMLDPYVTNIDLIKIGGDNKVIIKSKTNTIIKYLNQ